MQRAKANRKRSVKYNDDEYKIDSGEEEVEKSECVPDERDLCSRSRREGKSGLVWWCCVAASMTFTTARQGKKEALKAEAIFWTRLIHYFLPCPTKKRQIWTTAKTKQGRAATKDIFTRPVWECRGRGHHHHISGSR